MGLAMGFTWAAEGEASAEAQPDDDLPFEYAIDNLVAILYHELAHALIDILEVPILGNEELAADALAVVLIDRLHGEDEAKGIVVNAAASFLMQDAALQELGSAPRYWDQHGLDIQRYYTLACLIYRANPEERGPLLDLMSLPAERAEQCPREFEQVRAGWERYLGPLWRRPGDRTDVTLHYTPFRQEGLHREDAAFEVGCEVVGLNHDLVLPEPVSVVFDPCGEANAWYDPAPRQIMLCAELMDVLMAQG